MPSCATPTTVKSCRLSSIDAPDDARVRFELRRPEVVREHDDGAGARRAVLGPQRSAERGRLLEDVEVFARHDRADDLLRRFAAERRSRRVGVAEDARERRRALAVARGIPAS